MTSWGLVTAPMSRPARGRFAPLIAVLSGAALLLPACRTRDASDGQTLTLSVPYEVGRLDPHAHDRAATFAVVSHVYEALVSADANLVLSPALARRWENPDPLTWVFHLRPEARFHSGKPLTAADVVWSIERLRSRPDLEMASYVHDVESVRSLGSGRIEVKTRAPTALLLPKLRFVLVVPEGSDGEGLRLTADGTGPWKLVEFRPGVSVTLARNDAYWGEKPAFASAVLRLGRSSAQAREDFRDGTSRLSQCNVLGLEDEAGARPGATVRKRTSLFLKYLGFDLDASRVPGPGEPANPFLDPRVRKALHLALDRSALVSRLSFSAVPASQLVPPSVFGHDPDLPPALPSLATARRLLAEAGYGAGLAVTLLTRRFLEEPARVAAEVLAPAGFRVSVEVVGDEEFFDRLRGGRAGFYLTRRGCATGDFGQLLESAAHSRDPQRRLGLSQDGRYSNPELDREIELSSRTLDMRERREMLLRLQRRLMEELVFVPVYFDEDVYLLDAGLSWQPRADSYVLAQEIARTDAD
ncbi:MAG: hypothetical protein EDX89_00045 [Acidobacteria bacterium]|nr:MAG: hypothetical protein EDX89_00045 [Acidobacteriota bacterium]MCE7958373.1 hypothetical protein [Acidobacteria bacterium ACB2]